MMGFPDALSAFSPRAPIQNASPHPRTTTGMIKNSLPTGLDLIVRGIGARKCNSDAVKLLQTAVESIQRDSPKLADGRSSLNSSTLAVTGPLLHMSI